MAILKSTRIESIDILRGIVMILMALDHTRDYFHYDSSLFNPTNLDKTTPFLFFTRFITHYCAPVFVFLAGTSAYLYGSKKSKSDVFKFLLTRGIWLVIFEIFINSLNWSFDITYSFVVLQVIWAIGISMIVLSFLSFLPKRFIAIIGFLLVAGHNFFDDTLMKGQSWDAVLWYILHQQGGIPIGEDHYILFAYPVIPWIGLMALGYCLGSLYIKEFNAEERKKWLMRLGLGSLVLFVILRGSNIYGDLDPWTFQDTTAKTIMSFFNVTKYPPSLAYLLITIGPSLLLLVALENVKNKLSDIILVFGRVPLFYYFLHIFVIHLAAIIGVILFKDNGLDIITNMESSRRGDLVSYGYSLFITYMVWLGIVTLLYFPSKKYMVYKAKNKDKWWLSYL